MTLENKNQASPAELSIPRSLKLDHFFGRIDLIAIITSLAALIVFGACAAVLALIELARLISAMWADDFYRWLVVAIALAVVWLVARGRKLCVF